MRRCDVFIDASAYQAFGRSGLEAMACGAVPVLPALGGVHEYALDDENAMVLADGGPGGDRGRRRRPRRSIARGSTR